MSGSRLPIGWQNSNEPLSGDRGYTYRPVERRKRHLSSSGRSLI
jgi:hypothetical protein